MMFHVVCYLQLLKCRDVINTTNSNEMSMGCGFYFKSFSENWKMLHWLMLHTCL